MSQNSLNDQCDPISYQTESTYFNALYKAVLPAFILQENGCFGLLNHAFQQKTGYTSAEIPTIEACIERLKCQPKRAVKNHFAHIFEPETVLKPLPLTVMPRTGTRQTWQIVTIPLGRISDGRPMVIGFAWDISDPVDHERKMVGIMSRLEQEVAKRTREQHLTISALQNEIHERKRIGESLSLSRERLKNMSLKTLNVLEADRQTISKELHDSIGASLAAIKFSLEEKEINRSRHQGCLEESLDKEIGYLANTIKETKRISANLRPTTLDDLGLLATIQWFLRQFQRMYGNIRIQYSSEITEADVPETMKVVIYRIIQEGLSNAQKHSEAGSIQLQIGYTDGGKSISLLIRDDGRGFDVEEVFSHKDPLSGYGLTTMRERCEIFGGSFHIESGIGKGTKINVILPI